MGIVIHLLHAQPPRPDDSDNNVRIAFGAAAPPAIMTPFEERFGLRLVEVYGSTELGPASAPKYPHPRKPGTMGLPCRHLLVEVHDEDDNPLPPNTRGEIVARPAEPFAIAQGYWNEPRATIEAFRNLWFHSGDGGYLDDEGYVVFTDRVKDSLRRRGENISSFEVERGVQRHPDVLECAAYAVPAELTEDEVMIALVAQRRPHDRPAGRARASASRSCRASWSRATCGSWTRCPRRRRSGSRSTGSESKASRPTRSIARPPASPSPGARCTQDRSPCPRSSKRVRAPSPTVR